MPSSPNSTSGWSWTGTSATATTTARYVAAARGTGVRILDTRKTLPGIREAQKYALRCGGGANHRYGLYDAILIKDEHARAAGNVSLDSVREIAETGVDFISIGSLTGNADSIDLSMLFRID